MCMKLYIGSFFLEEFGRIRARFALRGEWAASDDAMLIATLKNGRRITSMGERDLEDGASLR